MTTGRRVLDLLLLGVALGAAALSWLVILGSLTATTPVTDLFWHLAVGRHFVEEVGGLTHVDPFSHTTAGRYWTLHEWVFQVGIYLSERLGGVLGVRFASCSLGVAVGALWLSLLRREGKASWLATFAVLALLGVACWARLTQVRPHLLTMILFLVFTRWLYFVEEAPSKGRIALFCCLQVVWTNLHSVALLGPLFYLGAVLGERVGAFALRRLGGTPSEPKLPLFAIPLLFAATLVSPEHVGLYGFIFDTFSDNSAQVIHDEWSHFSLLETSLQLHLKPTTLLSGWVVLGAGLALLARLVRNPRQTLSAMDPRLLAFGLVGTLCGFLAVRWVWFWFLPLLALVRLPWGERAAAAGRVGGPLLVGVLALLFFFEQAPRLSDFSLTRFESRALPTAATDAFLEAGLEGNLYNHYTYGGYLIYRLYPQAKVFIDGRTNLHGRKTMRYYTAVRLGQGLVRAELLRRAKVDVIFVTGPLHNDFQRGCPGWVCVYRDHNAKLYLPLGERGAENRRRMTRYYQERGLPFDPQVGFPP